MITLTAIEYQQALMMLPNPSEYLKRTNGVYRVAIAVTDGTWRKELELTDNAAPTLMVQAKELQFKVVLDRPMPYWAPVTAITIMPAKDIYGQ